MNQNRLTQMKAFLFDLDGCIYQNAILADGARELINQLRDENKKVCFVTNNSRQTSEEVCTKLIGMGIRVEPNEIITATEYVGMYLSNQYGALNVKVVGTTSLERSIELYGHHVYPLQSDVIPEMIVISRDIEFTYEKLQSIVADACRGAKVLSANPDMYHPGYKGIRVPETGSLVSSIEAIMDEKVDFVGKPAPYLFQYAMEICECNPSECVMVGDNPKTDIIGGYRAGMKTVWIRGNQKDSALERTNCVPDYVVQDIEGLFRLYKKELGRVLF
jgi:HAD superfamily hydrolase (TIGR01450 family)